MVVYDHGKRIEISRQHPLKDQLVAGCEERLRLADTARKCFAPPEEIRRTKTEGVAVEIHYHGGPRVVVLSHPAADGREREISFNHLLVAVTPGDAGCCTTLYVGKTRSGLTPFLNPTRNPHDIADLLIEALGTRFEPEATGKGTQSYGCGP